MGFESLLRPRDVWMGRLKAVDDGHVSSAKAVDNLAAQNLLLFLLLSPAWLPFIHDTGDRKFNRSSPSLELRLLVTVEKFGPDFHR